MAWWSPPWSWPPAEQRSALADHHRAGGISPGQGHPHSPPAATAGRTKRILRSPSTPTWPPASGTPVAPTVRTPHPAPVGQIGARRVLFGPLALNAAPPGAIVRSSAVDSAGLLPVGATAYRVIYHSESITGADIAESGLIVVPGGTRPPTVPHCELGPWDHRPGRPVRSVPLRRRQHPLPGSPGQSADDRGGHRLPGLGTSDVQPYLVGQSEAQGVLDAARAARKPDGACRLQHRGGHRLLPRRPGGLFSGQIAQSYAPELYVAGVVAVAPVTSLTELAPPVPEARTDGDAGFAVMALYAWSATYGDLPLSSVLTTAALREGALMTSACSSAVGTAYDGIPPTSSSNRVEHQPGGQQ